MGVQDRPQCFFEIEINREPGKAVLGALKSRFCLNNGPKPLAASLAIDALFPSYFLITSDVFWGAGCSLFSFEIHFYLHTCIQRFGRAGKHCSEGKKPSGGVLCLVCYTFVMPLL